MIRHAERDDYTSTSVNHRPCAVYRRDWKSIAMRQATAAPKTLFDAANLRTMRRRLLAWYRQNRRDLPWRNTADPYAIWVSEIMLQQTQVATVERYFPKFLAAFPTIAELAAAREEAVLRLWEGLGYYRRARQMHAAARQVVAQFGGEFPREFDAVRGLPGIGRYTAGAITSIAYGARKPILEANTIRLFSRLIAYRGDTASAAGQQRLWQAAEEILPVRGSGDVNQALMELGSQICTPRAPLCETCPLETLCPTRALGLQAAIPAVRRKQVFEETLEAAVIVVRRGAVLLRRCQPGERWAGLWDFPRFAIGGNDVRLQSQLSEGVRRLAGIKIDPAEHFFTLRHGVTRFRITLQAYLARCMPARKTFANSQELCWAKPEELEDFPLSTTGRKLAQLWMKSL